VPDVPDDPELPLVPDDPLEPEVPELPLVPDDPLEPEDPDVPGTDAVQNANPVASDINM
jgi:hypothetical protein